MSSIDFGPTTLNLAGIAVPEVMQGRAFLGPDTPEPRDYVFGGRDRMDERYDIIRMVRDGRFLYLRNYEPLKTYYQYMNTPEKGATMAELRRLHEAGELPAEAERYFSPSKPVEELYDYVADPHHVNNLATDPEHTETLERLRDVHLEWVRESKDVGLIPEPIIAERREAAGSEYAILRARDDAAEYAGRLGAIAAAASSGIDSLPELETATRDPDSAIRYWGAVGIGNLATEIGADQKAALEAGLKQLLEDDPSSAVRTAAARALCRLGEPGPALPVLITELTEGAQWERLHAAIVLDEIDDQALPVIEQMRAGLEYQKGFNSEGKYRVRVMNRALNELEGTKNTVK